MEDRDRGLVEVLAEQEDLRLYALVDAVRVHVDDLPEPCQKAFGAYETAREALVAAFEDGEGDEGDLEIARDEALGDLMAAIGAGLAEMHPCVLSELSWYRNAVDMHRVARRLAEVIGRPGLLA